MNYSSQTPRNGDERMRGTHPSEPPIQVDVYVQTNLPEDGNKVDLIENDSIGYNRLKAEPTSQHWHDLSWQNIPWTAWFLSWLSNLQPDFSPIHAYELTLRLTTDEEIQQLNTHYRGKNRPTDVLAFAAIDSDERFPVELYTTQPYYLGDIIISLETAKHQAHEAKHPLTYELAWLASHGLLHLLGWDHPDEQSLERMLNEQDVLLQWLDCTMT